MVPIILARAAPIVALWCILLLIDTAPYYAQQSPVSASVRVLKRWDLPDSIPYEILQAHYVVLRLTLKNNGSAPVKVQPDSVSLHASKGKTFKPAASSEVMLDIFNTGVYKRGAPGVHGEAGVGYPSTYPGGVPPYGIPPHPEPETGPPIESGTIAVDRGTRLRAALEGERFRATSLEPGQEAAGLLYFKMGKKAPDLSGGTLVIAMTDGKSISAKIP